MATSSTRAGSGSKRKGASPTMYHGPCGALEVFYIAELDELHQPKERLSGRFATRGDAIPALRWLRHHYPDARLIRELVFRTIEE